AQTPAGARFAGRGGASRERPGALPRLAPAAGIEAPGRAQEGRPGECSARRPATGVRSQRPKAARDSRLGQDVRTVLGPSTPPNQGAGRAQGDGSIPTEKSTTKRKGERAMTSTDKTISNLNVTKEIDIDAPIANAFAAM